MTAPTAPTRAPIERTEHPHVVKRAGTLGGEPRVDGTRIPVRQIYEMAKGGMSPDEIAERYPSMSLAQVHDALSYAYDHPDEIASHQERHEIRSIMRDLDLVLVGDFLVKRNRLMEMAVPEGTPVYTWETLPPHLER
jgi:uncharacterized protein (DUF433 family)